MLEIIALVATAEAVFLVTLLLFLLLYRVRESRREVRREVERERLQSAWNRWQEERCPDSELIEVLEDVSFETLQEFLDEQLGAEEASPDGNVRRRLRNLVRKTDWVEEALSVFGTPTRPWWRQLRALAVLRWVASDKEAPLFRRLLAEEGTPPPVLAGALIVLRYRTIDGTLEALLDRAKERSVARDRLLRDSLLAYGSRLARPLIGRLRQAEDVHEIKFLLSLTEQLPRPSLLPLALHYAGDDRLEVRVEAVRALRFFPPNKESRDALVTASRDPAWQVRTQAARGFGTLASEEALPALRHLLSDDSWWVRLRAGLALTELGRPGIEALKETARDSRDEFAQDMSTYVLRVSARTGREGVRP